MSQAPPLFSVGVSTLPPVICIRTDEFDRGHTEGVVNRPRFPEGSFRECHQEIVSLMAAVKCLLLTDRGNVAKERQEAVGFSGRPRLASERSWMGVYRAHWSLNSPMGCHV